MQAFCISAHWVCAAGPSDVYLTGYQTMTSFESWKQQHMSPEDYEDMEFGDDDDDSSPGEPSSDDEDSEDEGDVPNGVPLLHSEVSRCLQAVACVTSGQIAPDTWRGVALLCKPLGQYGGAAVAAAQGPTCARAAAGLLCTFTDGQAWRSVPACPAAG